MNEELPVYRFTDSELRALALFFRQNLPLPDELYSFNAFAEKYIYRNLTIGEAEQLYSGR
ncbi:hypothetical protein E4N70_07345 [Treponema vincentii]|jgi:hypothetical protein|uniref:hypothetical protein n=1 Tax=Treponema vincentii TaxID=69710 RepID=UPI0020A30E92|nr:hypothetical protein [Treponema vincentii]UTC46416.1 hypothetical protein E4N72_07485 [Treponema vincentii]UTC48450.1 hypothetical protein E4N73_06225 [Treponema vincentii]UTC59268.1 hypothetical protein E4N70_07345 [Treponema vincentii]